MRFLLKAVVPVEAGNRGVKDGSLGARLKQVIDDLKPEAVYFYAEDGKRTSLMIVDLKDASQIPAAFSLYRLYGPQRFCEKKLINLSISA